MDIIMLCTRSSTVSTWLAYMYALYESTRVCYATHLSRQIYFYVLFRFCFFFRNCAALAFHARSSSPSCLEEPVRKRFTCDAIVLSATAAVSVRPVYSCRLSHYVYARAEPIIRMHTHTHACRRWVLQPR